ncbi:MAG TPA: hypothetical protein ENN69_05240 [Spirochaetia bacterium]|nr:hypothetical protein [Spirochaetia bacterium]
MEHMKTPLSEQEFRGFSFTGSASLLLRALRYLAVIAVFAAILGVVALAVVYPLWYAATNLRSLYTIVVLAGIFSLPIIVFVLKLIRAVRGIRRAEFMLGLAKFAVTMLFLVLQVAAALVSGTLLSEEFLSVPFHPAFLAAAPGGALLFVLSLLMLLRARRRALFGSFLFSFCSVLLTIHYLYWSAVFVFRGLWLPLAVFWVAISAFFFSQKMATIKKEPRKNR